MKFNVFEARNSSVLYLYSLRASIEVEPMYQRMGDVWTLDKRQLLIDSIINEFDIPKIYFHDLKDFGAAESKQFSLIDGRQRLEAIWKFINGEFPLADDIEYLHDGSVSLRGLTYKEMAEQYPAIKQKFDSTTLSVFIVQTDDIDLIEEMFSRLNEAVPLNAAEKRNAFGGPLPKIVRDMVNLSFFKKKLKVSNRRYQHRDLAAKLIYLQFNSKILDTKKIYLDIFFKDNQSTPTSRFRPAVTSAKNILSEMSAVFTDSDKLLRSAGMVVLYYLLFKKAIESSWRKLPSRNQILEFESHRERNRKAAEVDISKAEYDLLEFDRYMQTPNDAHAIRFRLDLLMKHFRHNV
ncbi:MAG: DUF262 domain-containing protein [Alphaproteobacteria bacterium]|nr:DUF262 domain-containing protein [Alphaproteobacteria bacterium]